MSNRDSDDKKSRNRERIWVDVETHAKLEIEAKRRGVTVTSVLRGFGDRLEIDHRLEGMREQILAAVAVPKNEDPRVSEGLDQINGKVLQINAAVSNLTSAVDKAHAELRAFEVRHNEKTNVVKSHLVSISEKLGGSILAQAPSKKSDQQPSSQKRARLVTWGPEFSLLVTGVAIGIWLNGGLSP